MKNKLIMVVITILLVLTSAVSSYATDTNTGVVLRVTPTEVKVGESFTVTLNAQCPEGINGISTTYSYDEEKLELVNASAGSNFASLGIGNAIELISNSMTSITNADVYIITFKVKEGVEAGSKATISVAEVTLDSDASENSTHTLDAVEASVTVVAEENPPADDDGTGEGEQNPPADDDGTGEGEQNPPADDDGTGEGEQNPPADNDGTGEGEQNPPADDDGTGEGEQNPPANDDGTGEGEQNPPADNDGTGEGEQKPSVDDDKKDNTVADQKIPQAGLNTLLIAGIVAIVIITMVMYRKNKKYEDIK